MYSSYLMSVSVQKYGLFIILAVEILLLQGTLDLLLIMQVCATVDLEQADLREGQPAAILDALTSFRSRVRTAAKKHKVLHALEECDR